MATTVTAKRGAKRTVAFWQRGLDRVVVYDGEIYWASGLSYNEVTEIVDSVAIAPIHDRCAVKAWIKPHQAICLDEAASVVAQAWVDLSRTKTKLRQSERDLESAYGIVDRLKVVGAAAAGERAIGEIHTMQETVDAEMKKCAASLRQSAQSAQRRRSR